MTEKTENSREEAALWARARDDWRKSATLTEAPDALSLAAYLDGTLDPQGRERVEAWMAGSEDALDLVIAAREASATTPASVPRSLVRRAQALVEPTPVTASRGPSWLESLTAFLRPAPGVGMAGMGMTWAGAMALFLIVSASGFELGRTATLEAVSFQTALAEELSFGLTQSDDDLL